MQMYEQCELSANEIAFNDAKYMKKINVFEEGYC